MKIMDCEVSSKLDQGFQNPTGARITGSMYRSVAPNHTDVGVSTDIKKHVHHGQFPQIRGHE